MHIHHLSKECVYAMDINKFILFATFFVCSFWIGCMERDQSTITMGYDRVKKGVGERERETDTEEENGRKRKKAMANGKAIKRME